MESRSRISCNAGESLYVDKHRVLLLLCCMHAVFGPFKHALQTFDMDGAFVSDARLERIRMLLFLFVRIARCTVSAVHRVMIYSPITNTPLPLSFLSIIFGRALSFIPVSQCGSYGGEYAHGH